ncbi:MAG TPA: heavy metal-binding domain-containing protein [Cyclobacteriaceae bacterium]
MKKLTTLIFISGFSIGTTLLSSCGDHKKTETQEQTESENHKHKESEDKTVVYACSMHPEVTGKEGDTCSKCGMALEPVKEADSTKAQ